MRFRRRFRRARAKGFRRRFTRSRRSRFHRRRRGYGRQPIGYRM